MATTPDEIGHEPDKFQSRRGFFKWMGQVAAGASLAAIGLGIANPLVAHAQPDCIPCNYCVKTFCCCTEACCGCSGQFDCCVYYDHYEGCIPPGGKCPKVGSGEICQGPNNCNFSGCP